MEKVSQKRKERRQRKRQKLKNRLLHRLPFTPLNIQGSLSGLDKDKRTVIVVCHEASRTGAPVLGLNMAAEMRKKYNVIVVLLERGDIYKDFVAVSDAVIIQYCDPYMKHIFPKVVAKIQKATNVAFAVVNSIASRNVLHAFYAAGIRSIMLVHEFAAYTANKNEISQSIDLAHKTIFSAGIIRDSSLEACPEIDDDQYEVIPQGKCLLQLQYYGTESNYDTTEAAWVDKCFRPSGIDNKAFVIIGAGAVQYRKGVDIFIHYAAEVMKRINPDTMPIRFIWVGQGYDPQTDIGYSAFLEDQVKRSGLEGYLEFAGELTNIEYAYKKADLMAITSRLDPLPNVAIDAMHSKLPIICFDKTTGIADILKEEGLEKECIADYLDIASMAGKTLQFINSPQHYDTVANKLKGIASTTFNMDKYISCLEQIALMDKADAVRPSQQSTTEHDA
jgi:glycosyltransferase involved in cell wall biosynthesis